MKSIVLLAVIVILVGYLTKPSDEKCYSLLREKMQRAAMPQWVIKSQYGSDVLRTEDHFLYKTIYSKVDGHRVGYGLVGAVIMY